MNRRHKLRALSVVLTLALSIPPLAATMRPADAQVSAQRRSQQPLVPRSQARRQADRAVQQQVYVPGHWAFDRRRGQYSWVSGRWERYDPTHAFVGTGWHFRNGQWTFGPTR